jgi:hypothetical protein
MSLNCDLKNHNLQLFTLHHNNTTPQHHNTTTPQQNIFPEKEDRRNIATQHPQ